MSWWQNIIFSLWIIEDIWLAQNLLKTVAIVTCVLPVNMRFFPPGLYLLCTDAEGELLKFCNKNKLGFASTCFPPFNNASSLLLPASVYSSANYFCSQLTKINDGINIYWRSLWEQYASPEEGWVLFPSGKATQQTGLRVICCGAYRWSRSISGTPFMKIAFS